MKQASENANHRPRQLRIRLVHTAQHANGYVAGLKAGCRDFVIGVVHKYLSGATAVTRLSFSADQHANQELVDKGRTRKLRTVAAQTAYLGHRNQSDPGVRFRSDSSPINIFR